VLFVDEVGKNTSQKKYSNIGGEKSLWWKTISEH